MRVHVSFYDHTVVVPIPSAQLESFTVSDLLGESARRLAAATKQTPEEVQLTGLTVASYGSVLLPDDLVRDVLLHDEKLVALSSPKKEDGKEKEETAPSSPAFGGQSASAESPPKTSSEETKQAPKQVGKAKNGALSPVPTGLLPGFGLFGAGAPISSSFQTESAPAKFSVETKQIPNEDGEPEAHVMVTIEDHNLRNIINSFVNDEAFYEERPQVEASTLFCHLKQFKGTSNVHYRMELQPLIEWLDTQFEETNKKIARMLEENRISFSTLWYLFHSGEKVWGLHDELVIGGEVKTTKYMGGFFPGFLVTTLVVKSTGSAFFKHEHSFFVPRFSGTRRLDELPVQRLSPEVEAELVARGRRFAALALGTHFQSYRGHMLYRSAWFVNKFKADGRVMIDGQSFNRMNPNYREFLDRHPGAMSFSKGRGDSSSSSSTKLAEDQLYMAWPTVAGFSFSNKQWGEILIDGVSEVVFDDRAFDRLVLAREKKSLIRALVENNHRAAFSDVIAGKGGGCIFLLHGKPGVGKTLTAEAIAELLHRPLYSVSVGELGTQTEQLEQRLREILEVAAAWDAVILIDEADIFLEKRNETDIKRNAMVGIFLRLLEYHQGVLFLTSNRVKSFDGAFHSRISVALKYSELDVPARRKIWANLLDAAGVGASSSSSTSTPINIDKVSAYELNGRQIRTVIRLALSLAQAEGVPFSDEHVERTVGVSLQFKHDLDTMQADDCL